MFFVIFCESKDGEKELAENEKVISQHCIFFL